MSDGDETKVANKKIHASVERADLKKFFFLFTRKPNTLVRSFDKRIFINKDDINRLIKSVCESLTAYHVEAANISIMIKLHNNAAIEFGDVKVFTDYLFPDEESIDSISIVWDFMYSVDAEVPPDRYQLSVRISNSISPMHFLQKLVSSDQEEFDSLETDMDPCIARIDFINPKISEGLMEDIVKWNKGLRESVITNNFIMKIKNQQELVARIIHYSLPFFTSLISLGFWFKITQNNPINYFGYWLVISMFFVFSTYKIGYRIASNFVSKINKLGKAPVFNITKGDNVLNDKIEKDSIKARDSFIKIAIINILYGIISSTLVTFLFEIIKFKRT